MPPRAQAHQDDLGDLSQVRMLPLALSLVIYHLIHHCFHTKDSDDEGLHEETRPATGRSGRKSAAYVAWPSCNHLRVSRLRVVVSSVAARRDQNRIAQREFRQRKQQRV
jgi:hypothetical protein